MLSVLSCTDEEDDEVGVDPGAGSTPVGSAAGQANDAIFSVFLYLISLHSLFPPLFFLLGLLLEILTLLSISGQDTVRNNNKKANQI